MINYKMNTKMSESKAAAPTNECQICWNTFNKSVRSKVTCGHCNLEVCKACVRNYFSPQADRQIRRGEKRG